MRSSSTRNESWGSELVPPPAAASGTRPAPAAWTTSRDQHRALGMLGGGQIQALTPPPSFPGGHRRLAA